MFAKTFTLALLSAVVVAGPAKTRNLQSINTATRGSNKDMGRGNRAFLEFLSLYNKFPTNAEEFERRSHNFAEAEFAVAQINKVADEKRAQGVADPNTAAINWTADLDSGEYQGLLGLSPFSSEIERLSVSLEDSEDEDSDEEDQSSQRSWSFGRTSTRAQGSGGRGNRGRGRRLIADALTIDWDAAGKTTGVKDQNSCGSCWAFTGNTALEATLAIKTKSDPISLSEQQLIDCTTDTEDNKKLFGKHYKTFGCGGGWMAYGWEFQRDHGAMTEKNYPYTGKAQNCKHDDNNVLGKLKEWNQIKTTLGDAKKRLALQPMTVAVDASSKAFQFYKSGVLDEDSECGTKLNHALVIVGYTEKGAKPPAPKVEPEPEK